MSAQLSPQDALVATMIAVSAADGTLSDQETASISRMIAVLPVFQDYDPAHVPTVAQIVFELFEDEDGVDALVGLIADALPGTLNETAYALACDVAAADGTVKMEELRLLEIIRHDMNVDRLVASAIERGARARHARLPA